jgi:hypothetical protein
VPLALLLLQIAAVDSTRDIPVAARAGAPPFIQPMSVMVAQAALVLLPFAALALWRTWVYAKRWTERQDNGWQAVAEAAGAGLLAAIAYLAPGILSRPTDAPAYVFVYGAAALILGAIVGLILRTTALLVLRLYGRLSYR